MYFNIVCSVFTFTQARHVSYQVVYMESFTLAELVHIQ